MVREGKGREGEGKGREGNCYVDTTNGFNAISTYNEITGFTDVFTRPLFFAAFPLPPLQNWTHGT